MLTFTLCLWYWFLYCANKIHAWDKVICAAWFILGKYCTSWKEKQGSRPMDLHLKVTCYFSRFLLFKVLWKTCDSIPAQCSRGLLSQCLISFLVSCPNREPQEETVFTELSAAVGALWSLKATETHVWYFCFYPDWTFQVHVKGTESLQT